LAPERFHRLLPVRCGLTKRTILERALPLIDEGAWIGDNPVDHAKHTYQQQPASVECRTL
jgi:hypothetical protein